MNRSLINVFPINISYSGIIVIRFLLAPFSYIFMILCNAILFILLERKIDFTQYGLALKDHRDKWNQFFISPLIPFQCIPWIGCQKLWPLKGHTKDFFYFTLGKLLSSRIRNWNLFLIMTTFRPPLDLEKKCF